MGPGDGATWTAAARFGIVCEREHSSVDRANAEHVKVGAGGVLATHGLRHRVGSSECFFRR
jgi:hypothetical protein